MQIITNPKKIDTILNRGVISKILPSKAAFKKALMSGERLKFYIGIDPTGTRLHLSHAKNYQLLEEFRQLGHEVIILIGDFTARIGDPTTRDSTRKQLSAHQVQANSRIIVRQLKSLIDFKRLGNLPKIKYNSRWLSKLTLSELSGIISNFTVQQMIERDMFQKRLSNNRPIHLHEFIYPALQGFDSVALGVDVEIGGTDQLFNMMAGRTLTKKAHNKEKFVVTLNLMENPKTGELMSMSRGTGVYIDSSADELYGAIMAQPDEMIKPILINNTRLPLSRINKLNISKNPLRAKKLAALEVTKLLHNERKASAAAKNFSDRFQKGKLPPDVPAVKVSKKNWDVSELLVHLKLVSSKSEARRLLEQDGVKLNSVTLGPGTLNVKNGDVLRVGKRRIVKIRHS